VQHPATTRGERDERPRLSLVVVVHDMPEQARRTLHSLSPAHQRGVTADAYEILVVENASPRMLGEEAALATGPNVRYFARDDGTRSPVSAVNFGVERSRAGFVGVLVDGARLVTPGVVELALLAEQARDLPVLSVPGYHLGAELQQTAAESGYDARAEATLMAGIGWPEDGYRLFEVACFSGSCAGGFFGPIAESNCLCLPRRLYDELGGFDPRFVLPGGGYSNLDLYRRVLEHPGTTLFVTPGEGTFHQFHAGVTTGGVTAGERARTMAALRVEYESIRGRPFALTERELLLLGRIPETAIPFVRRSLSRWTG
jgi:hypothetical protein